MPDHPGCKPLPGGYCHSRRLPQQTGRKTTRVKRVSGAIGIAVGLNLWRWQAPDLAVQPDRHRMRPILHRNFGTSAKANRAIVVAGVASPQTSASSSKPGRAMSVSACIRCQTMRRRGVTIIVKAALSPGQRDQVKAHRPRRVAANGDRVKAVRLKFSNESVRNRIERTAFRLHQGCGWGGCKASRRDRSSGPAPRP